jgi:hypothetical protein
MMTQHEFDNVLIAMQGLFAAMQEHMGRKFLL